MQQLPSLRYLILYLLLIDILLKRYRPYPNRGTSDPQFLLITNQSYPRLFKLANRLRLTAPVINLMLQVFQRYIHGYIVISLTILHLTAYSQRSFIINPNRSSNLSIQRDITLCLIFLSYYALLKDFQSQILVLQMDHLVEWHIIVRLQNLSFDLVGYPCVPWLIYRLYSLSTYQIMVYLPWNIGLVLDRIFDEFTYWFGLLILFLFVDKDLLLVVLWRFQEIFL